MLRAHGRAGVVGATMARGVSDFMKRGHLATIGADGSAPQKMSISRSYKRREIAPLRNFTIALTYKVKERAAGCNGDSPSQCPQQACLALILDEGNSWTLQV